jgi:CPA2 family monovalent cation:H+ antiporter-2
MDQGHNSDVPAKNMPHGIPEMLSADLLLVFALAGLIIPLMQRLKVSSALAWLIFGMIIGPYGIGRLGGDMAWVQLFTISDTRLVNVLAELGIIFLLFMIGLELSFQRLMQLKRYVLGLGTAQILVTGAVIFAIARWWGNALDISLLIGAAFALSSTAMIMHILRERHALSRPYGIISFSVLLMQDLAVAPILLMLGIFARAGTATGLEAYMVLGNALLSAIVVIAGIYLLGRRLLRPLLVRLDLARHPEWLMAVSLFIVLGAATITQHMGLSAALGAFLAGMLLGETPYKHEIEVIIDPLRGLLMGVFFLSVGMFTDIAAVMGTPWRLAMAVVGIFVIKAAIIYPLARITGVAKATAAEVAILLAQCGEFALLVIAAAKSAGLIPGDDAQFFLLVAIVSMLLTPFTAKLAEYVRRWLDRGDPVNDKLDIMQHSAEEIDDHVIIAGFGRVGHMIGEVLESQTIPYIAIDADGQRVADLNARGYPVYIGDARRMAIWDHLNVRKSRAVLITIDDHEQARIILQALRARVPELPIIVRAHDTLHVNSLYEKGASHVVPETLESTLHLASQLLRRMKLDNIEADEMIDEFRRKLLA